jgi:hypothetical protein
MRCDFSIAGGLPFVEARRVLKKPGISRRVHERGRDGWRGQGKEGEVDKTRVHQSCAGKPELMVVASNFDRLERLSRNLRDVMHRPFEIRPSLPPSCQPKKEGCHCCRSSGYFVRTARNDLCNQLASMREKKRCEAILLVSTFITVVARPLWGDPG